MSGGSAHTYSLTLVTTSATALPRCIRVAAAFMRSSGAGRQKGPSIMMQIARERETDEEEHDSSSSLKMASAICARHTQTSSSSSRAQTARPTMNNNRKGWRGRRLRLCSLVTKGNKKNNHRGIDQGPTVAVAVFSLGAARRPVTIQRAQLHTGR